MRKTDSPANGIGVGGAGAILTHLDVPASNGVIQYISLPLINPCLHEYHSVLQWIHTEMWYSPTPSSLVTAPTCCVLDRAVPIDLLYYFLLISLICVLKIIIGNKGLKYKQLIDYCCAARSAL